MPNFESTWNPIGSGIKFDPLVPDAPVLKAPEPMCKLYPDMQPSGEAEPGLWGPPETAE